MADEQELLAQYRPTGGGGRLARPVTPPPTTRTFRPVASGPSKFARLSKPGEAKKKEEDGFSFGDILGSLYSPIPYVGKLIPALPKLAVKAGQTIVGAGEEFIDVPFDTIEAFGGPDLFKTRFERDVKKAEDLGLKGWEKFKYSTQRAFPLIAPAAEGVGRTAGSFGEVATLGQVDFGDPGFDYYQALKRGELGAKLLEDAGNVIMVGRFAGLGNVGASAGTALAEAGLPRAGAAVSAFGRLADEPIGETTRLGARGVGAVAGRAGAPRLAAAAGRVATAVPSEGISKREAERAAAAGIEGVEQGAVVPGPLRQIVTEVTNVRRKAAVDRFDELSSQIADLEREVNSLPIDDIKRQVLDEKIKTLSKMRNRVMNKTGWAKTAIDMTSEYQRRAEAVRTNIGAEIAAIRRDGVIRENVDTLRERAATHRGMADAAELDGRTADAQAYRDLADYTDRMANVKEADPQAFEGPAPEWLSPVVVGTMTGKTPIVLREVENGRSFQDIADIFTPVAVGPDVRMNNYRWTAADVEQIYRYATGQMSDAERLMVDHLSMFYKSWYDNYNAAQMEGIGGNEPLPFTYRQQTPEPKFLLKELKSGRFPKNLVSVVMKNLDQEIVNVMAALMPEKAQELGFVDLVSTPAGLIAVPKNVNGAFAKLARLDYNDPLFRMANVVLAGAFDDLLSAAPQIMRDPMIYPPVMRNMMFPEQRLLGTARAADVDEIAAVLTRVSTQFGDLLEKRTVDAIARKVENLRKAPARYNKSSLTKIAAQLDSVIESLRLKRAATEEKLAKATPELTRQYNEAITKLTEAEQALAGVRTTFDQLQADASRYFEEGKTVAREVLDTQRRTKLEDRVRVLETLLDSEVARQELDSILTELNGKTVDEALRVRPLSMDQKATLRKGLRGTGYVRNAPVTEGAPQGVEVGVLPGAEKRGLKRIASAQRAADKTIAKLHAIREKHARLDEAAQVSEAGLERPTNVAEELQKPVGPQLLGPQETPIYLPGGLTGGKRTASRILTELRQGGAAPQLTGSYERIRETDLAPLALTEVGQRISEILNQVQRNILVEQLVKDKRWAQTTASLLGQETIDAIKAQAEKEVGSIIRQPGEDVGLVPGNPGEFDTAVRIRIGELLNEQIKKRGYEAVSPVRVNEDATHQALGDLLSDVSVDKIDENTFLMRSGLRKQIVQQYVYQDTSSIPPGVSLVFDKVGDLTSGWKSYILPFSLRWQIGDAQSNILNAWIRGDIPPNELATAMADVTRRLREQGGEFNRSIEGSVNDPLLATLLNAGLQTRGQKLADLIVNRTGSANMPLEELQLKGVFKGFRQKAFRLNELQNQIAKSAVAIVKLEDALQAMNRSIDDVTPAAYVSDPALRNAVDSAVKSTNEALGAFSELSPFEKNVVRKVYPFWSWIKFINKAAVQMAIDSPERVVFMAHLGSMATEPGDDGFFDWLQGKTPLFGFYTDLSFLNPYQDAIIFSPDPAKELLDTAFVGISPIIKTPAKMLGSIGTYATGRDVVPFGMMQRPTYLEGNRDATGRRIGDLAGELIYTGVKDLVVPARNVFDLPVAQIPILGQILTSDGRLRGTDVAFGNIPRYPQGSPRLTGVASQPKLGPVASVVSAGMRTFGIPGAPLAKQEPLLKSAEKQRQRDEAAKKRRQKERQQARL